ncbi:MAG: TRAP transporter small permease [Proteobacteria bacterium]|nr:TRAP transporter small permease [Pseudomonadota bacterium]
MTSSDPMPPEPAPSLWRRFTAAYAALLNHLVVASIAVLLVPVSLQIFSRHTALIPSYIWTEEMARFLFVWTISIGAMIGVRESTHFEVDVMPELSPRLEAVARLTGRIGILVLACVFVFAGIKFVEFAWWRISELAELPLWLIHLPWPLMGVTWIIFLGEQMLDDVLIILGRKAPPKKQDLSEIDAGTLNI